MGKVTKSLAVRLNFFMGRLGLEPRTNRLKAEYSTIELATLEQLVFCSRSHDYLL